MISIGERVMVRAFLGESEEQQKTAKTAKNCLQFPACTISRVPLSSLCLQGGISTRFVGPREVAHPLQQNCRVTLSRHGLSPDLFHVSQMASRYTPNTSLSHLDSCFLLSLGQGVTSRAASEGVSCYGGCRSCTVICRAAARHLGDVSIGLFFDNNVGKGNEVLDGDCDSLAAKPRRALCLSLRPAVPR